MWDYLISFYFFFWEIFIYIFSCFLMSPSPNKFWMKLFLLASLLLFTHFAQLGGFRKFSLDAWFLTYTKFQQINQIQNFSFDMINCIFSKKKYFFFFFHTMACLSFAPIFNFLFGFSFSIKTKFIYLFIILQWMLTAIFNCICYEWFIVHLKKKIKAIMFLESGK